MNDIVTFVRAIKEKMFTFADAKCLTVLSDTNLFDLFI